MLKRWRGNIYSTSERNYQSSNKIQAKSSFRHVGGQEYALQHRGMPSTMAANANHTTLLKTQSGIKCLP